MVDIKKVVQSWKEDDQKGVRVVAFGSSNTELFWHSGGRNNWVDWLNINLREHIGRHVLVINQGICGDTAEGLLKRFDRDILSVSPQMVIITIGGNDAAKGFTYNQYYENIKQICTRLIDSKIQPVLQTYYCPIFEECMPGYRETFESFMEGNRILAKELGLPLIDQYSYYNPLYEKDRKEYRRLMMDMLHVNHIGNMIMGINASRYFGLPDPQIPEDIREEVCKFF